MTSANFAFRYRFWVHILVYVLGFVAPWDFLWPVDGSGPNAHVWGRLAVMLSRSGAMGIDAAFNLVLAAGIVCALAGALLRTAGSAYLGVDVMRDSAMRGEGVTADGPYRYVRNPLYVGAWLNLAALALLMPPSGAVFAIVCMVAFQLWLIHSEERFLRVKLGEAYVEYCARVPRIVPALRPRVAAEPTSLQDVGHPIPSSGRKPRWGQAFLVEIFMWGTVVSYAALGWRYDAHLLIQCVLVWFGVALVVKGVTSY